MKQPLPAQGNRQMTRYMVIEHFGPGKLDQIYKRFHEHGRMLPAGLHYIDSWLSGDGLRCFQLMETDNPALFERWEAAWSDPARFEIIELRDKPVAGGAVDPA